MTFLRKCTVYMTHSFLRITQQSLLGNSAIKIPEFQRRKPTSYYVSFIKVSQCIMAFEIEMVNRFVLEENHFQKQ